MLDMSVSNFAPEESRPQRKPLDAQRGLGGDMSMMFFVRTQLPQRFASPLKHQIKGLNVETIAGVYFPTPHWMSAPEYANLLPDQDDDSSTWKLFSLNLSIYNQPISPDDWSDKWFFMYGRVQPYALTWELLLDDDSDNANLSQEYAIPALMIRDHCYQPSVSRPLFI